jgi:hypothetical protein
MIELNEITTAHRDWDFVENLFLSAFPEVERRPVDAQRHNVDNEPRFHCLLAVENSARPVGFFTYWEFDIFCYCEHFAIAPEARNGGRGAQVIEAVMDRLDKPVVLEVEHPDDEMAHRRIGFYQRHGLTLFDGYDYIQPPYRPDGQPLPLLLMGSEGIAADALDDIAASIHRTVYGVKE